MIAGLESLSTAQRAALRDYIDGGGIDRVEQIAGGWGVRVAFEDGTDETYSLGGLTATATRAALVSIDRREPPPGAEVEMDLEERGLITTSDAPYAELTDAARAWLAGYGPDAGRNPFPPS